MLNDCFGLFEPPGFMLNARSPERVLVLAEKFFKAAGLTLIVTREPSFLPAGTILDQYPPAGSTAAPWTSGTVDVAQPFRSTPDVVGKGVDGARSALHARGFVVSIKRVASKKPVGTVVSQSPGSGDRVFPGQTVYVVVSGP